MALVQVLMFLWIVAPGSTVYVKGHSHAAEKARRDIGALTCYSPALKPESSAATLQVDHILAPDSQRSWVVLVMTDSQSHVLYEKKAEEDPWPLPSTMDRLLKGLAKSTCPQTLTSRRSSAESNQDSLTNAKGSAPTGFQTAVR